MHPGRKREKILDAGAALLAERGLWGCTIRDVAARAGISAPNVYRYVQGKEELLYLVMERALERATRSAEAALAVRGGAERLRSFVTDHIRRILAFPPEARLLQAPADVLPAHLKRRLEEKRAIYLDLAADIVGGYVRTKGVRRPTLMRHVQLLLGMADRVALDAARLEPRARPDRLAKPVLDTFRAGVRG